MSYQRDPQASWPFDPNPGGELSEVLRACDRDPNPVTGPAAKFLAYGGAHILVLTGGWRTWTPRDGPQQEWYQAPLNGHAVRGNHIFWERPKNSKKIPMPLSVNLQPWLKEWLDKPRPYDPSRYNQLFNRVGEGLGIHVNPLRFRHTLGVLLLHVHKLKPPDVEILMGIDAKTLATYCVRPPWMISEDLQRSGF